MIKLCLVNIIIYSWLTWITCLVFVMYVCLVHRKSIGFHALLKRPHDVSNFEKTNSVAISSSLFLSFTVCLFALLLCVVSHNWREPIPLQQQQQQESWVERNDQILELLLAQRTRNGTWNGLVIVWDCTGFRVLRCVSHFRIVVFLSPPPSRSAEPLERRANPSSAFSNSFFLSHSWKQLQ